MAKSYKSRLVLYCLLNVSVKYKTCQQLLAIGSEVTCSKLTQHIQLLLITHIQQLSISSLRPKKARWVSNFGNQESSYTNFQIMLGSLS